VSAFLGLSKGFVAPWPSQKAHFVDVPSRAPAGRAGRIRRAGRTEPRPRALSGLAYRVQRSGAVTFYRADDPTRTELFRDEGRFIAVRSAGDVEIT
jgi:hypothetical protein